jgi:light-regulated signal transduction histidine kinase (bacteriophytochrome)
MRAVWIVGASKVARDISARKQTDRILRESERRKDEFLATLSHELRSPLAPLTNALQLLEAAPDDPAIAAQARAVMGRQLQQLTHLVDDLMDISRVNRGAVELRRINIDIRTALVQAVEAVRPLIDAQGHTIHLELAMEPLWVNGDPTRLGADLQQLPEQCRQVHRSRRHHHGHQLIARRQRARRGVRYGHRHRALEPGGRLRDVRTAGTRLHPQARRPGHRP